MRRALILLGLLLGRVRLHGPVGTSSCWSWAHGPRRSSLCIPAAILVYPGRSASAALIRSLQSQPAFKKAGHRFQLVEDSAGLDAALKAGKYDLVVADVANANELSQQVASAASKPVLLPVAFKASKEEQSAAHKKYHCLLKAPGNPENYLDAIDHAMELKLKGKPVAGRRDARRQTPTRFCSAFRSPCWRRPGCPRKVTGPSPYFIKTISTASTRSATAGRKIRGIPTSML